MEYIEEYSSVANEFLNILTQHSQVICAYKYSKNDVSIGFIQDSVKKIEEITETELDFINLQGQVQTATEEVSRNTIEASALVYLYVQELIENKIGKHDSQMIFVGMRLKKYKSDLLGQICTIYDRIEIFKVLSEFLEKNNNDIEIFIVG